MRNRPVVRRGTAAVEFAIVASLLFTIFLGMIEVGRALMALAATLGSSLPQPLIGLIVDRWRFEWLAAVGVSLAGVGVGLSGLAPAYPMVFLLMLVSGLGVAMFHPPAGTSARAAAGESASAMSIFAAGGSAGFFLAPVLATPALVSLGLRATALFIPPALLIGLLLLRHQQRARAARVPQRGHVDRVRQIFGAGQ